MASEAKRYKFKGLLFKQEELTLREDGLVRDIIKANVPEDKTTIAEMITALEERGALKQLLSVILKPYQPTPLHRLWNAIMRRRIGTDEDVYNAMPLSLVAEIVADFFALNPSWLTKFAAIAHVSDLLTRTRGVPTNGQ